MDLSVNCECGVKTQVKPSMCGNVVVCDCGKEILVPRLSELRRNSGLTPFKVGIAESLHTMFVDGLLPVEIECVSCGSQTTMQLGCEIECERMFAKKPSYISYFLQFWFAPIWILGATKREYDNPEVHGRELLIKTPIRICESCYSKSNLKRQLCFGLLQKNDLYAKLLTKYPNATIVWEARLSKSPKHTISVAANQPSTTTDQPH